MKAMIAVGMKVKVYAERKGCPTRYGEVIGIRLDKKLVLNERPGFKDLRTGEFDLFRITREVIFLNPDEVADPILNSIIRDSMP